MKQPQPATKHRRKYDEQFKRDALRMIDNGQSVRSVAQALGIAESQLHKWKRHFTQTRAVGEVDVAELTRAAATGRDGAGHFKKSLEHFLPAELAARYEFVKQESANYEVKDLCEAVGVDRSSYYRSRRRGEQQEKEVPDAAAVAKVFWRHSESLRFPAHRGRVEGGRGGDGSSSNQEVDA